MIDLVKRSVQDRKQKIEISFVSLLEILNLPTPSWTCSSLSGLRQSPQQLSSPPKCVVKKKISLYSVSKFTFT